MLVRPKVTMAASLRLPVKVPVYHFSFVVSYKPNTLTTVIFSLNKHKLINEYMYKKIERFFG